MRQVDLIVCALDQALGILDRRAQVQLAPGLHISTRNILSDEDRDQLVRIIEDVRDNIAENTTDEDFIPGTRFKFNSDQ